jgi:hypothetical protein
LAGLHVAQKDLVKGILRISLTLKNKVPTVFAEITFARSAAIKSELFGVRPKMGWVRRGRRPQGPTGARLDLQPVWFRSGRRLNWRAQAKQSKKNA